MKKVLFSLSFLFYALASIAQDNYQDAKSDQILYTEVVPVEGSNKNELYTRASQWFAKTYKSSNAVLQMNDKDAGKLVGKAVTSVQVKAMGMDYDGGYVNYTITISTKDGKYKYDITDFYHEAGTSKLSSVGPLEKAFPGVMSPNNKQWKQIKDNTHQNIQLLIEDLKQAMSSKSEDNW